ncbi:MAG: gamma-glutamyl-gamma-aminobutyrate hydrolase family protein [Lachnospiraceae bacterium]|nr:gamma-glutamyl-gamma-aminobutyrate hydrolase family protein [Lachnospiraceae bacterium]
MKPIIGIIPLVDEEKDSLWMLPGYMNGISEVGGIPIMLPLTSDADDIKELLSKVQGILFTGGHDVNPAIYNEAPINQTVSFCKERDAMESEVLKQVLEIDMPLLGICRGIQFINAYLGGTLYQDIPTQFTSKLNHHHQSPPYDKPVHKVIIKENSRLFSLLKKKSLEVNSYHHQAVKDLAPGLSVMALAEDGLIEAIEIKDKKFAWAFQWHPEFSYVTDEDSLKIFKEFVSHCK